jgi:hypothetical protein
MNGKQQQQGAAGFTFARPANIVLLDNTQLRYTKRDLRHVAQGYAAWGLWQNSASPEIEAAGLPETLLAPRGIAEGIILSRREATS